MYVWNVVRFPWTLNDVYVYRRAETTFGYIYPRNLGQARHGTHVWSYRAVSR